jgi:DNA polymerase III sliding clamp (beta) subunit (PCNA family)
MLAFFNNVKNFVSKDDSRPMFQGICFDGKRAIATNTHVLIAANFPAKKALIHYKTGEEIKAKFPDVNKVIPKKTKNVIECELIFDWIAALKTAMAVCGTYDYDGVCLSVADGVLRLKAKILGSSYETILPITSIKGNPEDIYFSAKYLRDILIFFKDANVSKFTLSYNGPLQPMKFTADKQVLAVLTPIRTGN